MFKTSHIKKIFFIALTNCFLISIPPINIFRPSDRPLFPEPLPGVKYQFMVADESSYNSKAFQEDFSDFHSIYCYQSDRDTNVLRLYQDKQNLVTALKGVQSQTYLGQFLQKFNMQVENPEAGLYLPSAKFSVPYNLLFSYRQYFDHNLILALYLPFLAMELKDVKWKPLNPESSENIFETARNYGDLDLGPWKRLGIGDLVVQGIFMSEFPQKRPLIQNVRPQLRLAVTAPTGKKEDVDKIAAFPFANDGAWGVMTSGGLDVFFTPYLKAGFDAEILFSLGNTDIKRIRTNCDQTDLLLFTKEKVFKETGVFQQFNLYSVARWKFLQFKIDYQYLKQHESKVYVFNRSINPAIANDAQNLQEWSLHSFILGLKCYFDDHVNVSMYKPAIFGFVKLSILLITLSNEL